jgi:hypothetical protein
VPRALPNGLAARLEAGSNQQDKSAVHAPRPPSIYNARLNPAES